mmetsp:Transcript_104294/g.336307  ORF Transcript_104294/g.336307 Transcript_104294/m.336307 type:complete len:212 (+) Transcript_104294:265-900(+)
MQPNRACPKPYFSNALYADLDRLVFRVRLYDPALLPQCPYPQTIVGAVYATLPAGSEHCSRIREHLHVHAGFEGVEWRLAKELREKLFQPLASKSLPEKVLGSLLRVDTAAPMETAASTGEAAGTARAAGPAAEHVVLPALLVIREDLVGVGGRAEALLGLLPLLRRVAVWVPLQCLLAVGGLDLVVGCIAVDTQDFVGIPLLWAAAARSR